jgi:pimeloyl-ACP methyl ester carboxylesterase
MHTVYPVTTFSITIAYPSTDYPVPQYTTGTTTEQTNGWAFFTSKVMLHVPDWSRGTGRKAILAVHGSNQTAFSTFAPGDASRWGDYTRTLVDAGYAFLAMDTGGLPVGNNLALTAMDLGYTYLTGLTGGTVVGLCGSSAGALACLSWARKWPARVGAICLLNPFIDVETTRSGGWWTTPYSIAPGDPNAGITYAVPDVSLTNGAFKCTDDAGFITNAVDQGHVPARYPTDFAGQHIFIAHAQHDATVPYQSSQWWASAVGSPTVTWRAVTAATGDHEPKTLLAGGANDTATIAAGGLPRSAVRDFFLGTL